MQNEYRYILASNKAPKQDCPYCGAKKHWQRYVDTETGEILPDMYGRCDNEGKCSQWNDPYKMGYAKAMREQEQGQFTGNWKPLPAAKPTKPKPEPVFFDFETFKQTLQPERYEHNTFIQNLFFSVTFPFEVSDVTAVIELYRLGTVAHGYRAGAITFPFIDINGNVRAIQVKQFDQANHTTATDFLHAIIEKHHKASNQPLPEWLGAYNRNETKVSCLFGEHLLSKHPSNPVGLVEAPKTAVYGALYFGLPHSPESLIWLAVYNKSSFTYEKLKALQGRDVIVFPDLSKDGNTFNEWQTKAKALEKQLHGTRFLFSDLLEQTAPETDKHEGNDLADYLMKHDWRKFRKHSIHAQPEPVPVEAPTREKCEKCEPVEKHFFSHVEALPEVPQKIDTKKELRAVAFVASDGKVFIQTPFGNTFTVYNSIYQYNHRRQLPVLIPKEQVNASIMQPRIIDPISLTI